MSKLDGSKLVSLALTLGLTLTACGTGDEEHLHLPDAGDNQQDAGDTGGDADQQPDTDHQDPDADPDADLDADLDADPDADDPVYETCLERPDAGACADDDQCSWLGLAGCVPSDDILASTNALPISISGFHDGTAFLADHPVLTPGAQHAQLALWDFQRTLSGALVFTAADADGEEPSVAYRVTGATTEEGSISLILGQPRCGDHGASFAAACDLLASNTAQVQIQGGFEQFHAPNGDILSAFSRAQPFVVEPSDPGDMSLLSLIGMLLEPHGGFKPVSVPPSGDGVTGLSGSWDGRMQLLAAGIPQSPAYCSLSFTNSPVSDLNSPPAYIPSLQNCDALPDLQRPTSTDPWRAEFQPATADDPAYFQLPMELDGDPVFFSGILWRGLALTGVIWTATVANASLTHPADVPASQRIGVFSFDLNGDGPILSED